VRKKSNVSKKSKRQGKTEFETDEVRTLLRRASTFFYLEILFYGMMKMNYA
jgi:hypothetical protein